MTEELFSQLVVVARDALESRNKEKFEDILEQLEAMEDLDDYQLRIINELLEEYNEGLELGLYSEPGEAGAEDELLRIATDGDGIDVDKYRIFDDEDQDFEGFSVPAARDLNLAMKDDDEELISAYSEHEHSAIDAMFTPEDIVPVDEPDVDDQALIKEPEPMQFEIADEDEPIDESEPENEPAYDDYVEEEPEIVMDEQDMIEPETAQAVSELKHTGAPAGLKSFEPVLGAQTATTRPAANNGVFSATIPLKESYDFDLFRHKAKMYLLELCAAFVLALHPWKLIYTLVATILLGLLGIFAMNTYSATEPIVLNAPLWINNMFLVATLAVMWFVLWSIPVAISHMSLAQLEKRFVPNPLRSLGYVIRHFSVAIIWPFLIVFVFGGILYLIVAVMKLPLELPDADATMLTAAIGQYLLALLALCILGAVAIGVYLPPAIIGLGRSKTISHLTVKFFKLFVFRFPRILIYSVFLLLLTVASFALFGLVNYVILSLLNLAYTGNAHWGDAIPAANEALYKTTEWIPFMNDIFAFFNINVEAGGTVTAGTTLIAALVVFALAILAAYAFSVFFTGGSLVYAALRTIARRD